MLFTDLLFPHELSNKMEEGIAQEKKHDLKSKSCKSCLYGKKIQFLNSVQSRWCNHVGKEVNVDSVCEQYKFEMKK